MAKGRKRKSPDHSRRRTKTTVTEAPPPPLIVSIVTTPTHDHDGVSLSGDIDLVKAALLYADKVELISMSASMIGSMAALAGGGPEAVVSLMSALDDEHVEQMLGDADLPEGWRDSLPLLMGLVDTPMGDELGLSAMGKELAVISEELSAVAQDLVDRSGAGELVPCIDEGTLELSDAGFARSTDFDDVMSEWTGLLGQRLRDARRKLLFDAGAGDLVGAMLREGVIDSNELGLRRAGQAAVGAGLVARLPALPGAPMDELLDLRRDLGDPLGRYRRAVYRLSQDMRTIGTDADERVQMIWEGEVEPTIAEIRDLMADHGVFREIARSMAQDVKTVITGASVFVGFSGTELQSGLVAATAAGAQAVVSGSVSSRQGKQQVERNDLFYLYEVGRRLRH